PGSCRHVRATSGGHGRSPRPAPASPVSRSGGRVVLGSGAMKMTDLVTTTGRHSPVVQTGRAGRIKWWLVGIVAVLLGAWELAFHTWFMSVPMVTGHRLNALIAALLVGGVLLAAFRLLQQYEEQLATAAEELRQKNEALSLLEAERDTRLFQLARDLALA